MKIRRLDFLRFGCFSDIRLDLSEAGKAFHVIYGANEAGKSTALRGLAGLLLGIARNPADTFRHAGAELRIAAELEHSDGRRFAFTRRRGNSKTVLGSDGEPLPDALLDDFLGSAKEAWTKVFGLDRDALVRGGEELREGGGDLAESLFQAGTGTVGLHRTMKALDAEARALFTPAGRVPRINAALSRLAEADAEIRRAALKPKEWADKSSQVEETREALQKAQTELARLRAAHRRLERFQDAWPHAAQRRLLAAELAALPPTTLGENARREREDAERREREADAQLTRTQEKIGNLEREIAALEIPAGLLARTAAITDLHRRLDGYTQALSSLPMLRTEYAAAQTEATTRLRELQPGAVLDDAALPALSAIEREKIDALADEQKVLRHDAKKATQRAIAAAEELAEKRAALAETPEPPAGADALAQAIAEVQAERNLDAAIRAARAVISALDEQLRIDLTTLTGWSGDVAELEKLPVPLKETVEKFHEDFATARSRTEAIERRAAEAADAIRQSEARLQALRSGGEVPSEAELAMRRERRERGWQLVRRAWLDGTPDPAEERRFDPDRPLAEACERATTEADYAADRLRLDARRVAEQSGHLAERERACARRAEACAELERATGELAGLETAWAAAWTPAGISPASPREMRAWLDRCDAVRRAAADRRSREAVLREQEAQREACAAALRSALAAAGVTASATASLAALLEAASAKTREIAESKKLRDEREAEVCRLARAQVRAEAEKEKADRALVEWERNWTLALAPLGLGDDAAASHALLARVDAFHERQRAAAAIAAAIAAATALVEQFERDAAPVIAAVAHESAALPAGEVVAGLQARLAPAERDAARHAALSRQLDEERQTAERLGDEGHRASAELSSLLAQAGCVTREELLAAEGHADRHRELTAGLAETSRALLPLCGGQAIDHFLAQLGETDPDDLARQLAEHVARIHALQVEEENVSRALVKFEIELGAMDGSDRAAEAASDAQQAAAEIETLAARYVRLRLAGDILQRQIERFREANQGPVIRRASELFPKLTNRSFFGVTTGFDEQDRAVLRGVRPTGELVGMEGMSEGTRDQLYLALRIASLERQMLECEPLPFVLDDVLCSFDDDRARDTLAVLAELCHKTQVLFFTHHRHLVELAAAAIPADRLGIHELGRCTAAEAL